MTLPLALFYGQLQGPYHATPRRLSPTYCGADWRRVGPLPARSIVNNIAKIVAILGDIALSSMRANARGQQPDPRPRFRAWRDGRRPKDGRIALARRKKGASRCKKIRGLLVSKTYVAAPQQVLENGISLALLPAGAGTLGSEARTG